MAFAQEFKAFAMKGSVVDLAVAVVIGGAFGKIVSALVADLIMPLVGAITPSGDWRAWSVTSLGFKVGDLLGAILDFLVIAVVLFVVVVKFMGALKKKDPAAAPPADMKICPECLDSIPAAARKCRSCASVVTPSAAHA